MKSIHVISRIARLLPLLVAVGWCTSSFGQNNIGTGLLDVDGGKVTVKSGGIIDIEGSVVVTSGTLDNDGSVQVTGNWTRVGNYTGSGEVVFDGNNKQELDHDGDTIGKIRMNKSNHYTYQRTDVIVDSIVVESGLYCIYDLNSTQAAWNLKILDGWRVNIDNQGFFVTSDGNEQGTITVPWGTTIDSLHFTHDHSNGTGQVRMGTLYYRCVDCVGGEEITLSLWDPLWGNPDAETDKLQQDGLRLMFYTKSSHDRYWEYEIFYHYADEAPQFDANNGVFIWWESQISKTWDVLPATKTGDTKFDHVNPLYLDGNRQYFWSIVDGDYKGIDNNVLDLKVNLEGAWDDGADNMTSIMTDSVWLPLTPRNEEAYGNTHFRYHGQADIWTLPSGAVDWLLVDLRDANSAANAATAVPFDTIPCLLMENGEIRWAADPTQKPKFAYVLTNDLYVVVHHRNHADIMSSGPLVAGTAGYTWDFTTATTKAYNSGQIQLAVGKFGMVAGDTDVNGQIVQADRDNIWSQRNRLKYRLRDINFDGKVDLGDRIKVWNNRGFNVPIE